MAVARSSRGSANFLARLATALCGPCSASSSTAACRLSFSSTFVSALRPRIAQPFAVSPWRSFITVSSPSGMALVPRNSNVAAPAAAPCLSIITRSYAKRPKKWQVGPHAYVQVEPGAPCPPYSPNAGSVKKRKHNKRMAQKDLFIKAQSHKRKEETKAAVIKRDAERRKRWKEGAARSQAWAKHLQEQQANAVSA